MAFSDDVNNFLGIASNQTGVSQGTLSTLLTVENAGGDPNAVSSTGATGLFQFTGGTWAQYGNGASRTDPQASAIAAGTYWNDIQHSLTGALGATPSDWQTYLGYQQGPGTAATLLQADPNAPISQYLGDTAVTQNGGDYSGTVGQFLQHVQGQWTNAGGSAGTTPGTGTTTAGGSASSSGILGSFFGSFQSLFVRASVFVVGLIFIWAGLRLFGNRGVLSVDPAAYRQARSATQGSNSAGGTRFAAAPAAPRELARRAKEQADREFNISQARRQGIKTGLETRRASDIYRATKMQAIGAKPASKPKPRTSAPRARKPASENRATIHSNEGARAKVKYGPKVEK